ncbi:5-dehydro-2-deoxygluconokinase [Amycolatopsis sp. CA-161197]|uniref:5-dehydro-2-deoxygluconokinase n=1 Tax=Amycolatopsis sp. CA-161197 TaxID=3239922 RepID=UPI003D94FBE5
MTQPAFDVITMGRIGVDVYPLQVGVGLEEVTTFGKFLGGSPTNVAVAAARHGRRTAVITRVGCDPFGRFARRALTRFGVSDDFVTDDDHYATPVTFCEIFPPDDFPIYFYGRDPAPDLRLSPDDLDLDAVRSASILWITATGLAREPSRSATMAAIQARRPDQLTVLDLDYRPSFWKSPVDATTHIRAALGYVSVAVGNRDECRIAVGETEPGKAAAALRAEGVGLAIVKQGPAGVLGVRGAESHVSPAIPVEVVNGLGAGDAFGGALCHGLLEGWDLPKLLSFANAAGAYVATQLPAADAMPDTSTVDSLWASTRRENA